MLSKYSQKLISNNSSKKDTRLITLNEFSTFWLEILEEERYSLELTIEALPHPSSHSDNSSLSIIDNQAEFNHIIRIILKLEDKDDIMQIFKGLNLISIENILSVSYKE